MKTLTAIGFISILGLTLTTAANANEVPETVMQEVYREVQTPYKYGVVLKPEEGKMLDGPNVFRFGDAWYMMYIMFDKNGYETYLAKSADLLHWEPQGKILPYGASHTWDCWQADGGPSLFTVEWGGANTIQQFDGKYWMTYLGGYKKGYETDPLAIGVAWTKDPTKVGPWTRYNRNPVLAPWHEDARVFERTTLYKSYVVWDRDETLGAPFVIFYNGKSKFPDGRNRGECIGMAISKDMLNWTRYGEDSVVTNGDPEKSLGISGDPMVVKIGKVWVMFYFGAFWEPKNGSAFDTFACSYDLAHWTKWKGEPLIRPSEPWDKQYAHKPWVIRHNGVTYHWYCAVGDQGRVLALATSRDMRGQ